MERELREAAEASRGWLLASSFGTLIEKAASKSRLFGTASDFFGRKLEVEAVPNGP